VSLKVSFRQRQKRLEGNYLACSFVASGIRSRVASSFSFMCCRVFKRLVKRTPLSPESKAHEDEVRDRLQEVRAEKKSVDRLHVKAKAKRERTSLGYEADSLVNKWR